MPGKANLMQTLIAIIHKALQHVKAAAQQCRTADPRAHLLRDMSVKIAPVLGLFRRAAALAVTG